MQTENLAQIQTDLYTTSALVFQTESTASAFNPGRVKLD